MPDKLGLIINELIKIKLDDFSGEEIWSQIKKIASKQNTLVSKSEVIISLRKKSSHHYQKLISKLKMKPIRTISGVTPITVLTKPFPCPGKCIFCPSDIKMPKSYLSSEPGAQRAERNFFDPYLQTYNRLQALYDIGHPVSKAEIIILGGTWSFYPLDYQIWFIKEIFRALNDFGQKDDRKDRLKKLAKIGKKLIKNGAIFLSDNVESNTEGTKDIQTQKNTTNVTYNQLISQHYTAPEKKLGLDKFQKATWQELALRQKKNETASSRCVGLVIETRPDNISEEEVINIRRLGCTKTQIGIQSLNDRVLELNHRGHDVAATKQAFRLLRQAGFKIQGHFMLNLYGSSPKLDREGYQKLFSSPDFQPDELKIYPCSLIESAELMDYYQDGRWKPFSEEELAGVLSDNLLHTPEYCRLTRIIRDIPSTDIVVGNKKTNFRQIVENKLSQVGQKSKDIRSREIKNEIIKNDSLHLTKVKYKTSVSDEIFLQFIGKNDKNQEKILAFLRLALPTKDSFIGELKNCAMIREIHTYGASVEVGDKSQNKSQHQGLGKKLIKEAQSIAQSKGYQKLAVISAVGTREYYRKNGFKDGELYQFLDL